MEMNFSKPNLIFSAALIFIRSNLRVIPSSALIMFEYNKFFLPPHAYLFAIQSFYYTNKKKKKKNIDIQEKIIIFRKLTL